MLVVANPRQGRIPTLGDIALPRQEAQQTAEHHQPHPLALAMTQSPKLSRQEMYKIFESEVGEPDTVCWKTAQEETA